MVKLGRIKVGIMGAGLSVGKRAGIWLGKRGRVMGREKGGGLREWKWRGGYGGKRGLLRMG